ncbi:ABC transporter ATP-binding protein [Cellulosimicrobium composti]|uniref:ABC transporter ATP-binding protein n=1 Tax=Cellulosimicrobium composti TaxID=2672572 RepID=A0A6N7ZLP7_9MICO|nr:ABC transporter ATP-binding protein [Cellulosimicrobium composti]MTG90357.1 ATP-binding cassette domain-containing protein [Cellulosimicrobium composti]NDO90618.1 ABC transporter ATP-binding protein [Cellulosimicrobium composti]HEV6954732.1 ABC transporter ATP-binding protein [Promicromonospora sp.]
MQATTEPAIRVAGLGKTYRLGAFGERPSTAAAAAIQWVRSTGKQKYTLFDALDDVSFEVPHGEALGIVGRNGAGKSTLLKILTRVTAPTRGRIELNGRVGSLLEVGTGFHPELTGKENIYLNGAILGMTRKEITRRYDEIVAFSGIEKFLATPVKRYSSGMYVRLAFSVAAHLDTEILAIDEVLAVGDAEFQRRSIQKMREAARGGRTVLYVSHQLQTVQALCTSAVLLDRGTLKYSGSVEGTLQAYRDSFESFAAAQSDPAKRPGNGNLRLSSVRMEDEFVKSSQDIVVDFEAPPSRNLVGTYFVSMHINNDQGTVIAQCDSRLVGKWFDPEKPQKGRLVVRDLWLKPGQYTVDVYACQAGVLDAWEGAWRFEVLPDLPYPEFTEQSSTEKGMVFVNFDYEGV